MTAPHPAEQMKCNRCGGPLTPIRIRDDGGNWRTEFHCNNVAPPAAPAGACQHIHQSWKKDEGYCDDCGASLSVPLVDAYPPITDPALAVFQNVAAPPLPAGAAIDAAEYVIEGWRATLNGKPVRDMAERIAALRNALSPQAPAGVLPAAWHFRDMAGDSHCSIGSALPSYAHSEIVPLYAAPSPQAPAGAVLGVDGIGVGLQAARRLAAPPGAAAERPRCKVCGWTLAESADQGCVESNCCYRPQEGTAEYERIQRNRAALAAAEREGEAVLVPVKELRVMLSEMREPPPDNGTAVSVGECEEAIADWASTLEEWLASPAPVQGYAEIDAAICEFTGTVLPAVTDPAYTTIVNASGKLLGRLRALSPAPEEGGKPNVES